jgi:tetratricopeptide (TPR) repeat protein
MTPHPTAAVGQSPRTADDALIERLAEEMAGRWRAGERPLTEEFLDRSPDLWHRPDAALELIAEELALRDEYDCPTTASELAGRFPRWSAQVAALLDCQRVFGPCLGSPQFPAPGEVIGDFHLLAELGRGAHGRAYLATQPALAGRYVVLKVGPDTGSEHLSLARLQHTHVVPLYSAHEFPGRGLRGLCLPYFGGATLAEILTRLGRLQAGSAAGKDLLPDSGPSEPGDALAAGRGPVWEFLARASFEDAVCWVGACLADALEYAHDRGVLHLDLKPSNVLIAADGTPMLLDFHLARPPLRAGEAPPPWLGGTPGYVAPEQADAVTAVREGRAIPGDVDARADVYALGVLLGESLAAAHPGWAIGSVSVGLADVLARSRAADPRERYPTAAELAADLRRQLADLPLRGVGNRSLAERWGKWRRRRPYALPLAFALAALAAFSGGAALHVSRLADGARTAREDGLSRMARGEYEEAARAFRDGEALAEESPFDRSLRADLRGLRATAERGRTAVELHQFCERARPLYDAEFVTPEQTRTAAARCRELWDRREALAAGLAGQPAPELERQWRADLLDVAILACRLGERSGLPGGADAAHRQALVTLEEAEGLLGVSGALYLERGRHARAVGLDQLADAATRRGQALPPTSAWDHLMVGRSYLVGGDVPRAAAEFDRSLARDPRSLWAHYYRGVCCLRLGQPVGAVAAFSACTALAPDVAWCVYNRGLAYGEAGQWEPALADFDRALALDPALAAAYLGRAAVHHRAGRHAEALADLHRAADLGVSPAEVRYREALVFLAAGDRPDAVARLRDALHNDPNHSAARELLTRLTAQPGGDQPTNTPPGKPPKASNP